MDAEGPLFTITLKPGMLFSAHSLEWCVCIAILKTVLAQNRYFPLRHLNSSCKQNVKTTNPSSRNGLPSCSKTEVIISATLRQNTSQDFCSWKHEKNPQEWKKSSIINQMRNQEVERLWLGPLKVFRLPSLFEICKRCQKSFRLYRKNHIMGLWSS